LSVVLLAGAGLLLRSFDNLHRTDLGFEPDNLTRFRLDLPSSRYGTLPAITGFHDALEDRLSAIPGVQSVGSAFGPPLSADHMTGDIAIDGQPLPSPGAETSASMHSVTPGHLGTYRLSLLSGRWIEPADAVESVPIAVVSETFAQQNFPGEDLLGKRFRAGASFGWGSPVWTIVGVVGDIPRSLTTAAEADVYVPLAQYGGRSMTITVRSRAGIVPIDAVRTIVRDMDPLLPLRSVGTVADAVDDQAAPTRFHLLALATFASLAVLLACIGLYGLAAWLVARRNAEIGVRMALGARGGQVVHLILAEGLRPAATGVAIGLLLVLALGRLVESVLHGVSAHDPLILAAASALVLAVTMSVALLPALRASRIEPIAALRTD
jgi:predicted permease